MKTFDPNQVSKQNDKNSRETLNRTTILRKGNGAKNRNIPNGYTGSKEVATSEMIREYFTGKDEQVLHRNTSTREQLDLLLFEYKYKNLTIKDFDSFDLKESKDLPESIFIQKMIKNDKDLVDEKRLNEGEKSEEALLAELLFTEEVRGGFRDAALFGEPERVRMKKTTEFDDRFSHADIIAEWVAPEEEDQNILAMDVTISEDSDWLNEKWSRINSEINKGRLTNIKYYEDSNGNARPIIMIPRVIVVLEREALREVCLEIKKGGLYKSEIVLKALMQIRHQLEVQIMKIEEILNNENYNFASNKIDDLNLMKTKIERILEKVELSIENKKSSHPDNWIRAQDKFKKSGLAKKFS